MSSQRLRDALQRREATAAAVVPLIEAHAARLEQVPEAKALVDPEALARALRNAQALYGYDAVTVAASGWAVAAACHLAVGATAAPVAALRLAEQRRPLSRLPEPPEVSATQTLGVQREALRRLRLVLGDRAGTAVVVPTPAQLVEQTGGTTDWAQALLSEVVRFFGNEEPDLFLAVGPAGSGPLPAIADFFHAAWVETSATPGVVAVPCSLAGPCQPGWLFTTDGEVPADADPRAVAAGLARLGHHVEAGR